MPPPPLNLDRPKNHGRHPVIRYAGYTLLAIAGLLTGLVIYLLLLLGQPLRTAVRIVDPAAFTPRSLDDLVLPDDEEDLPWGEGGRARVYVHPDFPIQRVSRKDARVENILVFGIDARSTAEQSARADSIIILTIDRRQNQLKLTSIMRDTQVEITGRSRPDRINAAYAYGGVGLLINTINENFDLDIQRFAMFDFWSAAELIDAVGGVELDIQDAELLYLNQNLQDQNRLVRPSRQAPAVDEAGVLQLSGAQAIAWARIRKLDSDAMRTSRQRLVMMAMIEPFADASLFNLMGMMNNGLSAFETNMRQIDMLRLAWNGRRAAGRIAEYRVPEDGFYQVQANPWMMIVDWPRQIPALHNFIWGETDN